MSMWIALLERKTIHSVQVGFVDFFSPELVSFGYVLAG